MMQERPAERIEAVERVWETIRSILVGLGEDAGVRGLTRCPGAPDCWVGFIAFQGRRGLTVRAACPGGHVRFMT